MPWQAELAIWLAVRLSFPLSLPVSHFCRMFLLSWVPYCSHTELAGLPGLLLAARPPNRFFMCLGFPRLPRSGLCAEQPALPLEVFWEEFWQWEKIRWSPATTTKTKKELHQNHFINKAKRPQWQNHITSYIHFVVCFSIPQINCRHCHRWVGVTAAAIKGVCVIIFHLRSKRPLFSGS